MMITCSGSFRALCFSMKNLYACSKCSNRHTGNNCYEDETTLSLLGCDSENRQVFCNSRMW